MQPAALRDCTAAFDRNHAMPTAPIRFLLAAAAFAWAGVASAADAAVVDSSRTEADGTRTLQQSIEVAAPAVDVWQALTTADGWRSWAAPMAHVDFRLGGIIETSYDAAATPGQPGNIRNQIVAFVPQRMMAIRNVQAPPKTAFDAATFQSLHTVLLVEPVTDRRSRVTFVQPGYRSGEPWDTVYRHFAWGNGWTLGQLKTRFDQGPIDWKKLADKPAAAR
jgi:uncharacterized protein YndB with AHSA1/START domain